MHFKLFSRRERQKVTDNYEEKSSDVKMRHHKMKVVDSGGVPMRTQQQNNNNTKGSPVKMIIRQKQISPDRSSDGTETCSLPEEVNEVGKENVAIAIPEAPPKPTKQVQFDTVDIKLYSRIVGDHPDTDIPLALGWTYAVVPTMSVDEFEKAKQTKKEKDHPTTPFKPTVMPVSNGAKSRALQYIGNNSAKLRICGNSITLPSQFKYLEPISMRERIHLLKTVSGMTMNQINREERRRKMQNIMQWAYRQHDPEEDKVEQLPCPIHNCQLLYKRYIR